MDPRACCTKWKNLCKSLFFVQPANDFIGLTSTAEVCATGSLVLKASLTQAFLNRKNGSFTRKTSG